MCDRPWGLTWGRSFLNLASYKVPRGTGAAPLPTQPSSRESEFA